MLKKILFLLIYLFSWVIFFEVARVFFLLSTIPYAKETATSLVLQSLWFGLKMDLSMAAYLTILVCVFVIASLFIPFFRKKWIYLIYTCVILFIQLLLTITDVESFKAWGTRIDSTPLKFLSSPKEAWASINHLPLGLIFICLIIMYLLLFWLFRKAISKSIFLLENNKYRFVQTLLVVLFLGALIIPIRGGFQLSPLNQSSVFFSNNQYANNAAINASWNFMFSVIQMNQLNKNLYEYMKSEEADAIIRPLFEGEGKTEQFVNDSNSAKPNVILIIWESFTEKVLNKSIEGKPVIKFFPELMKEGIYFSNCYSSGDRTDKGISAIISGYPALPKGSIVNYPEKTAKLQGLGKVFSDNDYATRFYYGGEPEFMNIKSYLNAQKFQRLITKGSFKDEDMNSKWGAHDEAVMQKLVNDIPQMKQPFFTGWLTLSSHEPFETPVPTVFNGNDKETKFLNSLHYTDSVIYSFINELKKMPLWQNTIVIISADHGHYLPITGKRADDYRIPILWLGGALKKHNVIIDKTVDQLDMAGSLAQQLHFKTDPFTFGKNVFDSTSKHWAFFTYNDGIGFVTDSSRTLFDNLGKRIVFEEGKSNTEHERIAKALMQKLYTDFLNR
ncbi:MAG TPA: sulfatase-like hydrolase/transferase [Chitinophagaceae bacterium]|nr:sulfatase-like hydrolase/transferase [Chitinophagaceae bacterium]